jgi:hypothetical protein
VSFPVNHYLDRIPSPPAMPFQQRRWTLTPASLAKPFHIGNTKLAILRSSPDKVARNEGRVAAVGSDFRHTSGLTEPRSVTRVSRVGRPRCLTLSHLGRACGPGHPQPLTPRLGHTYFLLDVSQKATPKSGLLIRYGERGALSAAMTSSWRPTYCLPKNVVANRNAT